MMFFSSDPNFRSKYDHPYNYSPILQSKTKKKYDKMKVRNTWSDRMYTWNPEKFDSCCKAIWGDVSQYFSSRTHEEIERFMVMYFEKNMTLVAVTEHCNVSTGFPVWEFSYQDNE